MTRGVRVAALAVIALAGCPLGTDPAPVAVIVAAPDTLVQRDYWATVVTLDGRGSRDPISRDGAAGALRFEWLFDDPGVRFEAGTLPTDPLVRVRFEGTSPPGVTLRVRTTDGRAAESFVRLALTLR